MKKIILILILIGFTSCKSGWNCKKRYVDNNKIEKSEKVNS